MYEEHHQTLENNCNRNYVVYVRVVCPWDMLGRDIAHRNQLTLALVVMVVSVIWVALLLVGDATITLIV